MSVKIEKKDGLIKVAVDLTKCLYDEVYKTKRIAQLLRSEGYNLGDLVKQPKNGARNDRKKEWPLTGEWVYKDLDHKVAEKKAPPLPPRPPAPTTVTAPEPEPAPDLASINKKKPMIKKKSTRRRTKKTKEE